MKKTFRPSNLTKFIIFFPLLSLLIYGGLSYFIISYTQQQDSKKRFKKFVEVHEMMEKYNLQEKVEYITEFVNYYDSKVSKTVKDKKRIEKDLIEYIDKQALIHNGYMFISNSEKKVIYKPNENFTIEPTIYAKVGYYNDGNYLIYNQYIPKYDWYIHVVENIEMMYFNINERKDKLQAKNFENIKKNLYILLIAGIFSLVLSYYLSAVINRMLLKYENKIEETNKKLVFQSRQALMGELFSMIAHQWRQPINRVASIVALLKFKLLKNSETQKVEEQYNKIEDSLEFMSETIEDFRAFYLPNKKSRAVDIRELIIKSIDFMEGSRIKKKIKITHSLEEAVLNIQANELMQVMLNLIKNAIDTLDINGEISIKLYKENNKTIILVEDNGNGIKKSEIENIFEAYYSTKNDSMGLGLYMSRMIIEEHMKGKIFAKNLDVGIRFVIEI